MARFSTARPTRQMVSPQDLMTTFLMSRLLDGSSSWNVSTPATVLNSICVANRKPTSAFWPVLLELRCGSCGISTWDTLWFFCSRSIIYRLTTSTVLPCKMMPSGPLQRTAIVPMSLRPAVPPTLKKNQHDSVKWKRVRPLWCGRPFWSP